MTSVPVSDRTLGRLSRAPVRTLLWTLVAVGAAAVAFLLISGLGRPTVRGVDGVTVADLTFIVAFGSFLPLGAFIAGRRPENPIGWVMAVMGFSIVLSDAMTEYAVRGLLLDPGSLPGAATVGWLSGIVGIPGIGFLSFLMLLFPTGRLPSPRWRWVARGAVLDLVVLFIGSAALWPVRGARLILSDESADQFFIPGVLNAAWIGMILFGLLGLISLIVRFRSSAGTERQQLKAMAFVASVLTVFVTLEVLVFDAVGIKDEGFRTASETVLNLAVAGIPVTVALAILRYRLYDIDRVINRTLVYGVLTAILVGVYVGMVFGFQALLASVTAESDLAVAASTLAVAGLFRPVRTRVQRFIDHRFYRRRFDAQRTLETFSGRLRDEVDLTSLSSQLTRVVADTMQPAHVSLWIKGQSR